MPRFHMGAEVEVVRDVTLGELILKVEAGQDPNVVALPRGTTGTVNDEGEGRSVRVDFGNGIWWWVSLDWIKRIRRTS